MPELPEVENIIRSLAPHITGRRIVSVEVLSPRAAPPGLARNLAGRLIAGVRRHGKHIQIELDHGVLDIQLRMTGKLLWNGSGTHERARIILDEGAVSFDDIRQFGSLRWLRPGESIPRLGPDILDLTPEQFAARLKSRRGRIKAVLLDQALVCGLGNIYADEALFRARIHPETAAHRLSPRKLTALHARIAGLLSEAIEAGGSSISDYVDAGGNRGTFQLRHQVYGRAAQPCVACGTPIRKIRVAQRGTHYCPRCQPARNQAM